MSDELMDEWVNRWIYVCMDNVYMDTCMYIYIYGWGGVLYVYIR